MVNGFMHAYYLARSMDLSWGNRPSMDLSFTSSREQFSETQKKCKMEKCTAGALESSDLLCVDHEWLRHNIVVWKLINLMVICCNVSIPMVMILCNFHQILPLAFFFSLDIGSYALIMVGDIFMFGRHILKWLLQKKCYDSIV
jgi:hypothetical protein